MQRTTERYTAASDRQIMIGKKIEELVNEMKANVSARFGPLMRLYQLLNRRIWT
jgi:hypothetical protein